MCDDKCCQWIFLTTIIPKNPFFFLDAVGVVRLCCPGLCSGRKSPRPRGTGRLAHPPSGAALLSRSRCQAAQLSRADSCLPPSLLSHLQSELLRLPDLTLPICKEQHMELGLQSCKVAFQGKLERKATADRSSAGQRDSKTKMLNCCQQQMANLCKNAPRHGILIFKSDSTAWESWRPERLTKINTSIHSSQGCCKVLPASIYSQPVRLQDYPCKLELGLVALFFYEG